MIASVILPVSDSVAEGPLLTDLFMASCVAFTWGLQVGNPVSTGMSEGMATGQGS